MQSQKIKQVIKWGNLRIQLFEGYKSTQIPFNADTNIVALNESSDIIWETESPKVHYQQYFDIKIDDNDEVLVANTGAGYRHLSNGKILNHFLIK